MASNKQIAANRANAKQSSGPKTESGKRASRRNAFKHGLTGEAIVIGDEDPTAFEELRASFEEEFQAESALQSLLVERLAADTLRLQRVPVFEAAYIDFCYKETRANEQDRLLGDPFRFRLDDDDDNSDTPTVRKMARFLCRSEQFHNVLPKLSRYETALLNSFNRHLQQLMALMQMRPDELPDVKS